jgi:hypothetical protein
MKRSKGPSNSNRELLLKAVASNVGYLKLGDLVRAGDTTTARLLEALSTEARFTAGQEIYAGNTGQRRLIIAVGGHEPLSS